MFNLFEGEGLFHFVVCLNIRIFAFYEENVTIRTFGVAFKYYECSK
jgi:hypothetical protein